MTAFPSLRRLNVSYTLVHVIYWALFAVFAGYQTSLLLGRGFTSGEAGVFASIRCFAGILAQPLLGGWADRHPEVPIKRLLNVCLVLALGVNGVFYATRPGFWGTAVIWTPWRCSSSAPESPCPTASAGALGLFPTRWPACSAASRRCASAPRACC